MTKRWMEFTTKLTDDGNKLKIKTVDKRSHPLIGERLLGEDVEVYDIKNKTATYFRDGEKYKNSAKCVEVPTNGIEVQWREEEQA